MVDLNEMLSLFDEKGMPLVKMARELAELALSEKVRSNGQPFIEHADNVARIVSHEIGLPSECLAAVYLHEAITQGTLESIPQDKFGKDVCTMVDGLNKISTIKPKDTKLEAENYKKLIISFSTDPRVTILKLADRLEIMRSMAMLPKASRERKILESLMLYIPLAHQLGLYNMKSEMEDIYFKYAEPEQYRAITNRLKASEKDRVKLTEHFINPLKEALSQAGIVYKLKARTKTAFSIWKKMQAQKVDFDGVYDVFAIRFIIDCEKSAKAIEELGKDKPELIQFDDDGHYVINREIEYALCWKLFSFVTETYRQDTTRLRDWITNPKQNGYESLHITVMNEDDVPLEVQIRTKRMDEIAENGLASHWSYKGIKREDSLDSWLSAVRYSLENNHAEAEDGLPKPTDKEIFVFTRSGDLRRLPKGSSVLDFAFSIHSNIGIKCTGAKVNGKAASIREQLETGDVVEILVGKNQKPSPDWLNFVITNKARSKIRQKIKEVEYQKAAEGKELLQRRLKNWKMEVLDEEVSEFLKKMQLKNINSLYQAIGEEKIDVADFKSFIGELRKEKAHPEKVEHKEWDPSLSSQKSADDIMVIDAHNVKNIEYKMAKCCNPVFGDDVFGFVSIKSGVKIHRISCPNAARLLERYPYRVQKVRWSDAPTTSSFQTTLRITAAHEGSVINDIMAVINNFKTSIRSFNVTENERNGTYEVSTKISVTSNLELDKVLSQMRLLKNVIRVNRQ